MNKPYICSFNRSLSDCVHVLICPSVHEMAMRVEVTHGSIIWCYGALSSLGMLKITPVELICHGWIGTGKIVNKMGS